MIQTEIMSQKTQRIDGQDYVQDHRGSWSPVKPTPEGLKALLPAPPPPPPASAPPPPTIQEVKRLLDQVSTAERLSARDAKIVATAIAEREGLERSIDLENARDVGALTRLQTLTTFGPARVALRRQEELALKVALEDEATRFSRGPMSKRLQELESAALAKVEPTLKGSYSQADTLRGAALQTDLLLRLDEIRTAAHIDTYGPEYAVKEAQKVLDAWNRLEDYARAL